MAVSTRASRRHAGEPAPNLFTLGEAGCSWRKNRSPFDGTHPRCKEEGSRAWPRRSLSSCPGQEQPASAAPRARRLDGNGPDDPAGRLKQSVRVGAQRGAAVKCASRPSWTRTSSYCGIAGGPALYLRPDSAFDLCTHSRSRRASEEALRKVTTSSSPRAKCESPPQLQWRGFENASTARSGARRPPGVLLDGVDILTDAAAA
jgi:hypothetical protein